MKRKKRVLLCLLAVVISVICFELYIFYNRTSSSSSEWDSKLEQEKRDEKKDIDRSKFSVADIFTPYNQDNLGKIFTVESDKLYYYLIDGLLDKRVQDKVNDMIKDTVHEVYSQYHDKYDVASYIYSNFENTASIVVGTQGQDETPEDFKRRVEDNSYYSPYYNMYLENVYILNVDLTTGDTFSMEDVINDKNVLRNKVLENVYEDASKKIGLVCSGGPCENDNADYSELEDSVLSVMNKFNGDSYTFKFDPEGVTFFFKDVYMYDPWLDFDEKDCDSIGELEGYKICNDYAHEYSTYIPFIDLVDNVIIYDRFKTENSIYMNSPKVIDRKFTVPCNNIYDVCNYMDERMVEDEEKLIDYNYYFDEEYTPIKDKLYANVIEESSKLTKKGYNIFNISEKQSYIGSQNYKYFGFYVYHYSMSKEEYQNYRKKIFLSKYRRYEYFEGDVIYNYGYDFLEDYLDKKAFYYYIYDKKGNQISTSDVFSDSFDFSTIIPNEWLSLGKYTTIEDMVDDALLIGGNPEFVNDEHLVIYNNLYDSDEYLVLKYKGKKVVLAKDYDELTSWKSKIFK